MLHAHTFLPCMCPVICLVELCSGSETSLSYADGISGISEVQGVKMGASPLLDVVPVEVPLLHFGARGT